MQQQAESTARRVSKMNNKVEYFGGAVSRKLFYSSLKGLDTDVELQCGKNPNDLVHCHLAVLKSESEVFRVMLDERCEARMGEEKNNRKRFHSLLEDDVDDVKNFLKLLYGFDNLRNEDFTWAVPAWKLAVKYRAERVSLVCNEYFKKLARHVDQIQTDRLLKIARAYGCSFLARSVMKLYKRRLRLYWPDNTKWQQWDEESITEILGTDSQRIISQENVEFSWSRNECVLLEFALKWLQHRRSVFSGSGVHNAKSVERESGSSLHTALAHRVLSKIRFRQIASNALEDQIRKVAGVLNANQIGQIFLMRSGVYSKQTIDEETNFIVDNRLRNGSAKCCNIPPTNTKDLNMREVLDIFDPLWKSLEERQNSA